MIMTDGMFNIVILGWLKLSSELTDEGPRRIMVLLDLVTEDNAYNLLQQETVPPSLDSANPPPSSGPNIDEDEHTTTQ